MLCWLVDMGKSVYVCVVCLYMCIIHICVLQVVSMRCVCADDFMV